MPRPSWVRGLPRRTILTSSHDYTNVTIGCTSNLVGHALYGALNLGVIIFTTHQALNGKDCIFRVGHSLPLGNLAYQPLTTLGNSNNRGSKPRTFAVLQYLWLTSLHD